MSAPYEGNGGLVLREVWSPGGRGGEISEMIFSADGAHLLTGTRNFAVRIWGTCSGKVELLAPPLAGSNDDGGYHAGHLSCDVVLNPARGLLMPAGSATGGVIVWTCCEGGRRIADLRNNGHEYGCSVAHLAAYPDGRYFISADRATLKVWSADDFKVKRTIRSAFEVKILVVSARCRYIFCAGENDANRGVVSVWNGHKRGKISAGLGYNEIEPSQVLEAHGKPIRSLHVSDNPDVLVTTALDGMAKMWDVPSGSCTRTIWSKRSSPSPLSYAALVNRGVWLLTSCEDGSLQVWSTETGRCLLTQAKATADTSPHTRLAVSRCGRLVALATEARIQIIDFDKLADLSEAERRGEPWAYLRHALRFITSATRKAYR